MAQTWQSQGELSVLGTGLAFPGSPVTTETLVGQAGLSGRQRTLALSVAERMDVRTRHISRNWTARIDTQAEEASNPALAAQAINAALRDAGLRVADLGYLIAHTATPTQPLPSNVAFVADILGYAGPHVELRQACTGFANALMIAFGLVAQPGARPVAIVGSETGSVFLDLQGLEGQSGQIVNLVQMGDGAGPGLLLLDEPTAGPDVATRRAIWRWLGEFAAAGHIVIVSTHDLAEAQNCPSVLHYAAGIAEGPMTPADLVAASGASNFEDAVLRLAGPRG